MSHFPLSPMNMAPPSPPLTLCQWMFVLIISTFVLGLLAVIVGENSHSENEHTEEVMRQSGIAALVMSVVMAICLMMATIRRSCRACPSSVDNDVI